MDLPFIHLKPAVYSDAQTVDEIAKKLEVYPEQRIGTDEAMAGKTIEFITFDGPDFGQPVGSLSEWVQSHKVLLFKVSTRDGDDIVIEADTSVPTKFIIHPEQKNVR